MMIKERIEALRVYFRHYGVKAFIVPSTDPHMSEYVAPHWEARQWISGFTGSAGTVVITETEAGLWTDSRYFLQAAEQLQGTGIDLYKEKLPETPTIADFLKSRLSKGDAVGIDGQVFSVSAAKTLQEELSSCGILLKSIADPFESIWNDRPSIPQNPVFIHELQYAGKTIAEKLSAIREQNEQLNNKKTLQTPERKEAAILVSALDEIAWTLNLRGNDVHCNPVFISYLFITESEAHLFIMPEKITEPVKGHLEEAGVHLHGYQEIIPYLRQLTNKIILFNPSQTNYATYNAISEDCDIEEIPSPIALLKAIRNEVEIANLHQAMIKDGVAMVKFLKWLDQDADIYHQTEMSIDHKLHSLRAAQEKYIGESFDTIAGYGAHGAIVHYEATPATDTYLEPKGFLLLDSGAQYLDGTTDITRTISLGTLTQEEKEDYTLILKGHIDLAMAVFPERTRGAQLDILARQYIWKRHMNYLHGTGHGVGSFLNVHEGPHSIRMEDNPITLQAGMVVTNEPGLYKVGSHGIRTENILLVVPSGDGMFGNYLQFETVTLCPIDKRPIIKDLLSDEEINWLNKYHQRVYDLLSPQLDYDERYWLANATTPL